MCHLEASLEKPGLEKLYAGIYLEKPTRYMPCVCVCVCRIGVGRRMWT